ncbi:peptidoglycan recognition protein family protein [Ihubacter massiliensis]|uniref:N-acetylmuramoyl-L-alanine amidase n=1 Tax=Hominibacterium faecale TaxID=2839743 RepID=A0A9J6QQJ7_9FIRM|nr:MULTISPECIES: peptidoglycan recognition family protein [Eubacteriales Family XIII. Incertae Sedis]MCO7123494.1 peptidoglycan recognition protein family protein [Ihubacter massiliensis]MCU7379592.1 peptidoglycan recognition protein family protein [Hominibacterium faecale]
MPRTTVARRKTAKKPIRQKTRTKRGKQGERRKRLLVLMFVILALMSVVVLKSCFMTIDISKLDYPSFVQQDFIGKDGHSRTGKSMKRVNDIVIHYVANPGSSAKANRDFFDSSQSSVSAHFVVGLKGEVIQCVPLNEQSSASNDRNPDTISIEVCHPKANGKFNSKTYGALIKLTAWLCDEFGLDEEDVIRHYDITGKDCPKYYVEHPDAWKKLKKDVKKAM